MRGRSRRYIEVCEDALVWEAHRRRRMRIFRFHIDKLKTVIRGMAERAEIYLFGSVAEDRYVPSSDRHPYPNEDGSAEALAGLWGAENQDSL